MLDYDIQPWRKLNIDISNVERKDFNFDQFYLNSKYKDFPGGFFEWRKDNLTEVINQDWLDYMESINLEIDHLFVFFRKSYYQHPEAHVDIYHNSGRAAVFALNFVLDSADDSEMVWYKLPEDTGNKIELATQNATQKSYTSWPTEQVKDLELARCTIGRNMTMVSVGIPHNVIVNSKSRWCLSFRIKNNFNTWNDAVKSMKPYIC